MPNWGYGLIFIVAAILCLLDLYFWQKAKWLTFLSKKLWLVAPQQALLVVSAYGSILAMIRGSYADGTIVPRPHIIADLHTYPLLCLLHILAIIALDNKKKNNE